MEFRSQCLNAPIWQPSLNPTLARTLRSYTPTEKAKITAGAVTALVIVAWLVVVAFALLAAG